MGLLVAIVGLLLSVVPSQGANRHTVHVPPICFRVDKTTYDPSYMDNKASVDSVVRLVNRVGEDHVESIHVVAYSSPEGWLWHNNELSKKRAYELRYLFRKLFPGIQYTRITCEPGGESWGLLREMVDADTSLEESSRERILKILDDKSLSNEMLKRKMKDLGEVYEYLLHTHYKHLRLGLTTVTVSIEDSESTGVPESGSAPVEQEEPSEPAEPSEQAEPAQPEVPETVVDTTAAADTLKAAEGTDTASASLRDPVREKAPSGPVPSAAPVVPTAQAISARKPLLGISTNIPYDITFIPGYGLTSIPSISIEFYPNSGRYTFGADVEWPMWQHWDRHAFMQINNVTLWARRYFKPAEDIFKGPYLFGNLNSAQYGIGWDEKGWEGEGVGASVGLGYKRYFGRSRFFFDTGIGLGVFWSRYDPYVYGNDANRWYYYDYTGKPEDFRERSKRLLWMGPTRLYFSIGYDLLMRKKK